MPQKCSIGCQNRQQMLTMNERHMALQVGLIRVYVSSHCTFQENQKGQQPLASAELDFSIQTQPLEGSSLFRV